MNTNQFIPDCDDHFDMEIPDADDLSNKILMGCLLMLVLFAVIGFGSCLLVAGGYLHFN